MTDSTHPTVHEAIGRVIADLEGVKKEGINREQNYRFRSLDDVLKAVHPLLGKHGVFFCPKVIRREVQERVAKSGAKGQITYLEVLFRVYGPAGDSVELITWGEGLDWGDKSTNKAMTGAFKYALFQLFAVSDPEDDADRTTPEAGSAAPAAMERPAPRGARERAATDEERASERAAEPDQQPARAVQVTQNMVNRMRSLLAQRGIDREDGAELRWAAKILEREVVNLKQLTLEEYHKVYGAIPDEEAAPIADPDTGEIQDELSPAAAHDDPQDEEVS